MALPASQRSQEQTRAFFLTTVAAPKLALVATGALHDEGADTSYFAQTIDGVTVEGAYAMAQARGDQLRYARHYLVDPAAVEHLVLQPHIDIAAAAQTALLQAQRDAKVATARAEPTVLRIIFVADQPHLAWRVAVNMQQPWESRALYIDAHDGTYLTYKRTSHDEVAGHVRFKVERECMGDKPKLTRMPHTVWNDDDKATNRYGRFTSTKDVTEATIDLKSPFIKLENESGSVAGPWTYPLAAAPAANELEIDDAPLDQIDPYYHVLTVREWLKQTVKTKNAQTRWANEVLHVNVNVRDTCNAYYDGSLNFFKAGDGCLNTGRTADVVYHEYGHGIHEHSPATGSDLTMDDQVSEGIADYVAATITGNPNMRGLFACDDNFRSCVNELTYCAENCDMDEYAEVHDAGQVICAVWWEFREQMVARQGKSKGIKTADRVFLKYLSLVGDMNSSYEAAIAADDDNDDDVSNGTTHSCELNRAFANPKKGAIKHFPSLKNKVPCHK